MNQMPFVESWRSRSNLSDGKIYSNHPNINTVRKAMHALQYGNMDHFFEAFDENAKFDGLFSDWDADDLSIDEFKNMQTEFLNNYSIESVDNRGINITNLILKKDWFNLGGVYLLYVNQIIKP